MRTIKIAFSVSRSASSSNTGTMARAVGDIAEPGTDQYAEIALESNVEDSALGLHQVFATGEFEDEAISYPAGCLAGGFQSQDFNDEVNRTERANAAAETFHGVVSLADADRCGSIIVLMKLGAPAMDIPVIAQPQIEDAGDFEDGDLSINEP